MEIQGAFQLEYQRFSKEGLSQISGAVPAEEPFVLYVNQFEMVTLLCTPIKLDYLVLGFLYSEGIISKLDDILSLEVCEKELVAMVMLKKEWSPPRHRVATSGCGGGVSFWEGKDISPVESNFSVSLETIFDLMHQLNRKADLFRFSGGVHSSAISDGKRIITIAEDIGRHNTVDKILGECLSCNIPTNQAILLTTGRLSSEIVFKAARAKIPLVVSMKSPTSLGIEVAQKLGITLVGHVKGRKVFVYTHPERIIYSPAKL